MRGIYSGETARRQEARARASIYNKLERETWHAESDYLRSLQDAQIRPDYGWALRLENNLFGYRVRQTQQDMVRDW